MVKDGENCHDTDCKQRNKNGMKFSNRSTVTVCATLSKNLSTLLYYFSYILDLMWYFHFGAGVV